ncbi:Ku protein [Paenibacillus periandrae]|uniref:non-homologous end joining protein Ku n=1 Tax=Paenibacillus periandrae TaxID=1761741 RepID=UPI001F09E6EC|nr:Ku protein [Paenibacillus periandrae]
MHSVWNGTIRIAKLQFPVKLYSANEDKDISFKQLHDTCGKSISHQKFCSNCNVTVEKENIQRTYDLGGGHYIEITDSELNNISRDSDKCISLDQFVNADELDALYFKKHYYCASEQVGQQAFHLLQTSLQKSNKIGIGYITIRSNRCLAAVRAVGEGIVLSLMYYADEVRPNVSISALEPGIHPSALEAISRLVDALSTPFTHEQFRNHQKEELTAIINAKITNQILPTSVPRVVQEDGEESIKDIVAAIQRSIESVKEINRTLSPDQRDETIPFHIDQNLNDVSTENYTN